MEYTNLTIKAGQMMSDYINRKPTRCIKTMLFNLHCDVTYFSLIGSKTVLEFATNSSQSKFRDHFLIEEGGKWFYDKNCQHNNWDTTYIKKMSGLLMGGFRSRADAEFDISCLEMPGLTK